MKVYGGKDEIVILSNSIAEAKIYSITGMLVSSTMIEEGTQRVSVPSKGIYIVAMDGKSYKVVTY